jgi:hypothetical protein
MPECYYCGNDIVDRDRVIQIEIHTYREPDTGYLLAGGEERLIHADCLRG